MSICLAGHHWRPLSSDLQFILVTQRDTPKYIGGFTVYAIDDLWHSNWGVQLWWSMITHFHYFIWISHKAVSKSFTTAHSIQIRKVLFYLVQSWKQQVVTIRLSMWHPYCFCESVCRSIPSVCPVIIYLLCQKLPLSSLQSHSGWFSTAKSVPLCPAMNMHVSTLVFTLSMAWKEM